MFHIKTPEQHFELLKTRGLNVLDESRACRYLRFIGYYRLSGYFIPFQIPGNPDHTFLPDTTFDHILQTYIFDRKLKLLVMDAVERIEVAVRTVISDVMSLAHGPHWYMNPRLFVDKYNHSKLLQMVAAESGIPFQGKRPQKTSPLFCRHYIETYQSPELPPVWMVTEILTMGNWSIIYRHLRRPRDKKTIAGHFNIHPTLLTSWLEAFTELRNHCAHHARVWNRIFTKKPKVPNDKWMGRHFEDNRRFYAHAAVLNVLMKAVSGGSTWQQRFSDLIRESAHIPLDQMGFIDQWNTDGFWGLS